MQLFNKVMRTLALAALLSLVAACSEYIDRRDTIALSGGNAVATNVVTHMVDPWPRESANRNIAFNGPKIESAFERYRTNRVITPRGIGTSGTYQDAQQGGSNNSAPVGQSVTQSSAPVK